MVWIIQRLSGLRSRPPVGVAQLWIVRHSMFRILSFGCLLVSVAAIAVMTLNYVDPPITDPLLFGFVKSDRYLPAGDSISRTELYSPVQKLLADDRRAYRSILFLSGVALLSAFCLFLSSSSRGKLSNKALQATAAAPSVLTEP